jgi:DNA-binding CsgD family transcriptional regulator/tetratricopeptide (TPR) repeat protein
VRINSSAGPTVGRDLELEQLNAALEGLSAGGAGGCVTVEGEPGIGKTHVLAALCRRAETEGCVVLAGSATEFERDLPFSVWVDALDAYVASQELDLDDGWSPELVEELSRVIPSVRPPGGGALATVADERYRSHRAVRRLLGLLAAGSPLVVVLDDLHWSDEASIELLAGLLQRPPDAPVLLAIGFRAGRAPARLSAALGSAAVRRIQLAPLDEAHATELLGEVDPRAAAVLVSEGGGNPFYLEQLKRAFADGGGTGTFAHAGGADVAGVPVPASVAASLAEELASLPAHERTLLCAAAVAGEPFEPDLAGTIAELASSDVLSVLDALLARDLVRPTTVPRRFVFRHPLVRRAVYESAPAGWRLAAHARAADALAARGAGVAERAHHVEQYAGQGDEQAIALLLEAGAAASTRAPAAAARWYDAVLALLPASDEERSLAARIALASSLRSLGELDRCRSTLLGAIELLPADAAPRRVELTANCAAVEHWLGRHEEAHRRLARAWDELPDHASAEAAVLGIELAVDGLYELDFGQSLHMAGQALATARAVGDPALTAAAAAVLCLGEAVSGCIDDAREHRLEAVDEIAGLSDAQLASRLEALFHLAWAETYLECYEDAVAHAERGIVLARTFGEGRLLVPLTLAKNFPFEMQGRLVEALECCEAALDAARLSASQHELYRALFELGWTRYYAGDLEGAIAAHEESAQVDPRLAGGTIPNGGGGPGWGLGAAWVEAGETERGRDLLLALVGEDGARTMPVERCFDWETLTIASLALGDIESADGYASRAEEDAGRLPLRLPRALADRARAAVLLAQDEPLEASRRACRSTEDAEAIGARLQAAFSRGLQGRALVAAGGRRQATTVLREAEQELDACGSTRVRDEMRRELRRLGARAEPRGPAAPGDTGVSALTKRELEIAGLVTNRMTNREIGAALFLSDKTIESHIRNVFHKLGVSSRVEIARAIERDRREHDRAQRA